MFRKLKAITSLTLVLAMSFFLINIAQCQERSTKDNRGEFRGYFMFGGSNLDIKSLNKKLESKGYSKFSDNFVSFGGGCFHRKDSRWMIGGEGHFLFVEEQDATIASGNYKTSLSAAYGFFNLGYLAILKGGLNVYPVFGIGGGGMWLKIAEDSFDKILENPNQGSELSTGVFLLNLALGTDYLLKLKEDEKGESGLVLGVRVGYTYAPFKEDWETSGIQIAGGPELGITGPYVRFMIGGGGKSK
jgi:hypothetical protein